MHKTEQPQQVWDLACAELCGWGHYKMRGQLTAQREEDFQKYLQELSKSQFDDGVTTARADLPKTQE